MLIKRNHRFAIKELPHFAYCKFIFHEDKRSLKVLHWKEGKFLYKLSFFFSPVTIQTSIYNQTLLLGAGVEVKVYVSFVVHETDRKPEKQTLCLKLSISLCVCGWRIEAQSPFIFTRLVQSTCLGFWLSFQPSIR